MAEHILTLDDYLAILKRRKWQLVVPFVLLAAVVVAAALLIPPTYRSSATILIEQQEIPPDLVRTTVTSYADQRIHVISQRVLTTANLSEIITRHDLYPEIRRRGSMNIAVERMRGDVQRRMISADVVDPKSGRAQRATIAFSLSYSSPSPTLAQKVVNDIVNLFLNENLRQREAVVKETQLFLAEEAKKLDEQMAIIEAQLAAFKDQHGDSMPEMMALTRELIARAETRLTDNAQAMRAREEQIIYLESELLLTSPQLGRFATPEERLRELEASYPGVAASYSPQHPDRVKMERELAALRKELARTDPSALELQLVEQQRELAKLRERYSENHPDVKRLKDTIAGVEKGIANVRATNQTTKQQPLRPTNPAYIQLQARLEAANLELRSLRQTRSELETVLANYEQRLADGPRIEQEYRALMRDYDNAHAKYREVKDKTMQADIAQALESERKGERFSLIEPPLLPEKPEKPNRPAIILLGAVLSVAGGVGNLALREVLDKSIHGARALMAITQGPPLAVIPYIETRADRRRRVARTWLWILGVLAVLVGTGATVHFFVMPLDVLWFTLLRKIELSLPASAHLLNAVGHGWNA